MLFLPFELKSNFYRKILLFGIKGTWDGIVKNHVKNRKGVYKKVEYFQKKKQQRQFSADMCGIKTYTSTKSDKKI